MRVQAAAPVTVRVVVGIEILEEGHRQGGGRGTGGDGGREMVVMKDPVNDGRYSAGIGDP
ncbi:MAG: hypothetical protein AMXMBFR55_24850 [Gemmatimonadota bacterium]